MEGVLKRPKDFSKVATDQAIMNAKSELEAHGFTVEIVDTLADAKESVLNMIPNGADVFTGTSITLEQAGITHEINESGEYKPIRSRFPDASDEIERRRLGSASDYAVGSVHAITENGEVLIASNSGSQLPNYVYGANHYIWVVGAQKIVKDLNEGFERIETHTLPLEDERAMQAYGVGSQISKLLIYRREPVEGRGTIIIFKESVGY